MIKFLTVPVLIALLIVPNSGAFAGGMGASSFAPGHHYAHFDHFRHRHTSRHRCRPQLEHLLAMSAKPTTRGARAQQHECVVPRSRRRILVTGAAGLIGSELCGQLAERGHAVIALVHRRHEILRNNGSVLHPEAIPELLRDMTLCNGRQAIVRAELPDKVIHSAVGTRFVFGA